jgi:hypothetical protein
VRDRDRIGVHVGHSASGLARWATSCTFPSAGIPEPLCDALRSALGQPGTSLDSACETVTQALRQRGEDDMTLVLARIRR